MKFFKITLLLSIGFISFNTVPTSVLLDTGNPELERMAMDGVGATRTTAILPGVATPKTAILPGMPTPQVMSGIAQQTMDLRPAATTMQNALAIDTNLQTFAKNLREKMRVQITTLEQAAAQECVKAFADYIVKNYGQMIAKALVNQMFPSASKVATPSASERTTAQTLLNTLTVTLGQGMKDDIVAELKNRFYANPMQMLRSK